MVRTGEVIKVTPWLSKIERLEGWLSRLIEIEIELEEAEAELEDIRQCRDDPAGEEELQYRIEDLSGEVDDLEQKIGEWDED